MTADPVLHLHFHVTPAMVDAFAGLTGDRSSLHVDAEFARRSPYRRRVVHGMLPVVFLSQVLPGRLHTLVARFLKPVYLGEELDLSCVADDNAGDSTPPTYTYTLTRAGSGETVMTGTVAIVPVSVPEKSDIQQPEAESIVGAELRERVALWEELEKGETASFSLQVTLAHREALRDLLAQGLAVPAMLPDASWLYAACTSTYVGMCMPGRYATYTELVSFWDPDAIDDAGESPLTLTGRVSFLSVATRIAVAKLSLGQPGRPPVGQGTVKVRVGDPPRSMPSMQTVQAEGLDAGLAGRVVLVTGASRGLGETIAKLFAAHGARVVVNYYRGAAEAEQVVEEITAAGGQAISVGADVTDPSAVDDLFASATRAFGPVEVLVNNAVGDVPSIAYEYLTWSDCQRSLDIILKGAFHCCQAALPGMVAAGYGRIINLSTLYVEVPPPGYAAYVCAKSALLGLTRSLAVEYASHGITVNAVMPGMVETDLTANVSSLSRETHRREIPMQRLASPLDVARAVVFLASDAAAYTTGQQLPVTGGLPPFH